MTTPTRRAQSDPDESIREILRELGASLRRRGWPFAHERRVRNAFRLPKCMIFMIAKDATALAIMSRHVPHADHKMPKCDPFLRIGENNAD
jgi:hypothetical protein